MERSVFPKEVAGGGSIIESLGRGQGCAAEAFKTLSLFKTKKAILLPCLRKETMYREFESVLY